MRGVRKAKLEGWFLYKPDLLKAALCINQCFLVELNWSLLDGAGGQRADGGGLREAELNEELEDLLADMQRLTAVFDGLTRPGCLPPPGRALSGDQVTPHTQWRQCN